MKKLSLSQMEKLQGGKFWGAETSCSPPMPDGTGWCHYTCTDKYYIFWIVVSSQPAPGGFFYCPETVIPPLPYI